MGLTSIRVKVKKSREARRSRTVEFLVDSGAVYSVVRAATLRALGCRPYREEHFALADGSMVSRPVGDAYFEYSGVGCPAPVIFGEPGDKDLLGVTALEAMKLVFDPFKREVRPMTMPLMGAVLFRFARNGDGLAQRGANPVCHDQEMK